MGSGPDLEFVAFGETYASINRLTDASCDVCHQLLDDVLFFRSNGFGQASVAVAICPGCLANVLAPAAKRALSGRAKARSRSARKPIRDKVRWTVLERDEHRCKYCNVSEETLPPGVSLEVDHFIPVALGGKTELANLRTACTSCNRGKGATIPASAERWIRRFLEQMAQLASLIRSSTVTPREMAEYVLASPEDEQQGFLAMGEEISDFLRTLMDALRTQGFAEQST